MFIDVYGEDGLKAAIFANGTPKSVPEKLKLLVSLANSRLAEEGNPVEVRTRMLHTLGLLQSELGDHPACEKIWRELAPGRVPTQPDLAAISNLAMCLNAQEKYPEAEPLLRTLTPLIQLKIGENSPQALSCYRMLAENLKGQGRSKDAQSLLVDAKALIERIEDEELKKDETEAFQHAILLVEA